MKVYEAKEAQLSSSLSSAIDECQWVAPCLSCFTSEDISIRIGWVSEPVRMPWGREKSVQVIQKCELFDAVKYASLKNIPTP
jgi:hypothetical protein